MRLQPQTLDDASVELVYDGPGEGPRLVTGSECKTPLGIVTAGLADSVRPIDSRVTVPAASDDGWICLLLTARRSPLPGLSQPSGEVIERLRALGYVD